MTNFGSQTEPHYLALVGDVVHSRRQPDRAALQRRLTALLADLGAELGDDALVAPLELTGGDEVQGLFRRAGAVVQVIRAVAEELHPVRVVHGIGFGSLSTDLAERPTLMDGPCFHRARAGLERARKGRLWVVAQGFGAPWDEALTAMFTLMDAIRARWTPRQAAFIRAARRAERQLDVARAFEVSPSVVSESLSAASFRAVLAGERAVAALLERLEAVGVAAGEEEGR